MIKNKKTWGMIAALVLGVAAAGFSFDVKSFPAPIQKGNFLISGGLGIGTFHPSVSSFGSGFSNSTFFGASIIVDYALPINFALTVGGETGFYGAKINSTFNNDNDAMLEIPIIARVAWHPNWEIKNLDTYVLVKLGFGLGIFIGDVGDNLKNPVGFIYGTNIGGRYFFTSNIGVFGELGYEGNYLSSRNRGLTFFTYATKLLTLGVTFKL
jgi:hypothetical protein